MRLTWEFFSLMAMSCVPHFEYFVGRGVNWFQEDILERLDDHSFYTMLSNLPLDLLCTCLKSCVGLGGRASLFAHLVFLFFV